MPFLYCPFLSCLWLDLFSLFHSTSERNTYSWNCNMGCKVCSFPSWPTCILPTVPSHAILQVNLCEPVYVLLLHLLECKFIFSFYYCYMGFYFLLLYYDCSFLLYKLHIISTYCVIITAFYYIHYKLLRPQRGWSGL